MDLLSEGVGGEGGGMSRYKKKFLRLNRALAQVIDDYALVKFHPVDTSDEDSIGDALLIIDNVLQYGEDLDVREPKEFENNEEDNNEHHENERDNDDE